MKVNMYTLKKDIEDLKKELRFERIHDRLECFRPIDYREHIKTDLSKLEIIWKYNKGYYKESDLSALHDMAISKGYKKTKQAFKTMLKNPDRQKEFWIYNIQLIYVVFIPELNYYLTCEGNILTKNSLTKIKYNPYNSEGFLYLDGEKIVFNRAAFVFNRFLLTDNEEKIDYDRIFYFDGFYGNCGVDNLTLKDAA